MHIVPGTFSIVLLGDWNKMFIQPDWVATYVYENPEIEIGVEGVGSDFTISYRKNNVVIKPTQDKIVFSLTNISDDAIVFFSNCVKNYIAKAYTPVLTAFGINIEYTDEENTKLAAVFDKMDDLDPIVDLNYEITATKVSRSLLKNGVIMNIESTISNSTTLIRFNEHHDTAKGDAKSVQNEITPKTIRGFLEETAKIVQGLGYEVDKEGVWS